MIWDVKHGIGTCKFVFNVQLDGLSIKRESVYQFLTIVISMMLQELALHAIKDLN